MNRRRTETRTPAQYFWALILAAVISAGGGVLHAYYKNRQIQVSREIDAIDRRVEQYRLDIRTTDWRMSNLLNRFAIRKQIESNGSSLRPIPIGVVDEIETGSLDGRSVAAVSRNSP
jgi:hypothetical protein